MSKFRILSVIIGMMWKNSNILRVPMGKGSFAYYISNYLEKEYGMYRCLSRKRVKKALKLGLQLGIIEKCEPMEPYNRWPTEITCYRLKEQNEDSDS